jgi:hypothetical protein
VFGRRHSEIPANLLKYMGTKSVLYSECALILFRVPADFDSTIRRFESSRPSQAVLYLENFLSSMRKARQMRAFLIANSLWRPTFAKLSLACRYVLVSQGQ